MKHALTVAVIVGVASACLPAQAHAEASAPAPAVRPVAHPASERIDLFVGDSRVLNVRTRRMTIGNGRILAATPINASQLVLIGEAPGTTVLQLWLRDGTERRIVVNVAANDVDTTLLAVRELLAGAEGIQARALGRRIVLDGDAAGARGRERAAAVAALYPGVVLDFVGKVGWENMIHFDVRIVEFRRGKLRDLGIRWRDDVNGPNAGVIADFLTNPRFRLAPADSGVPAGVTDGLPTRLGSAAAYLGLTTTLESRLRLLEQSGDASIVAEPTLSCRSGGAARFVAGGEIPVPVVNGVGSTTVEYREYGVILDVHPVADSAGAVFARIETELSDVDNAQRVLGVPGLLKRRSVTDINLLNGETLVIAGLTSRRSSSDVSGLPGLARIPAGGYLFGARSRRRDETEIVIFLTPRIIRPAAAGPEPVDPNADGLARGRTLIESARGKN